LKEIFLSVKQIFQNYCRLNLSPDLKLIM